MSKEHAYLVAHALPTDNACHREAAELLRAQADKIDRLERELAQLKPHADCDSACMTACAGEAKEKLQRYEGLLLWTLYHHQGASSPIGQPIRSALEMGEHDDLTHDQVSAAKVAAHRGGTSDGQAMHSGQASFYRPQVTIDYTNWRGVRSQRRIQPRVLHWGQSEYHPEPQFLLRAWDVEKRAMREFAMKDIHAWAPTDVVANDSSAIRPLASTRA